MEGIHTQTDWISQERDELGHLASEDGRWYIHRQHFFSEPQILFSQVYNNTNISKKEQTLLQEQICNILTAPFSTVAFDKQGYFQNNGIYA